MPERKPFDSSGEFGATSSPWELIQRLLSMDDATKQQVLDAIGEMAGGTAGALAGGGTPASIAGAGFGAVAGRSGARLLGKAAGLKQGRENTANQELKETAKAFFFGAGGEGAGRAVPLAGRALKNLVKMPFRPTAEARVLAGLAEKYGVPLNLGQATGKKGLQTLEIALDRSPLSVDIIRNFRQGQYKAWDKGLNDLLESIHAGKITPEEFARQAETSFQSLRNTLNEGVSIRAAGTARAMHPTPVTDIEAGMAQKAGRKANLDNVRKWSDEEYGALRKESGSSPIDVSDLEDAAVRLREAIPDAQLAQFFPSKTLKWIQAAKPRENAALATARNELAHQCARHSLDSRTDRRDQRIDCWLTQGAARTIQANHRPERQVPRVHAGAKTADDARRQGESSGPHSRRERSAGKPAASTQQIRNTRKRYVNGGIARDHARDCARGSVARIADGQDGAQCSGYGSGAIHHCSTGPSGAHFSRALDAPTGTDRPTDVRTTSGACS